MLTLNDGRSELWQWDTGRKLTVDDECSQVHFSNKVFGRSIDVDVVGGVAIVPDILLQTDKELTAWAFVGTAENGYTKISKVFKVNKRNKPANYVFTAPDQTTLGEILDRIEDLENRPSGDVSEEDIQNAVKDYLDKNPVSFEEKDPTVPAWAKQPEPPKVEFPKTLPNPNKLTFKGAVTAEYDGSKAVTVEIPEGGGGGIEVTGAEVGQTIVVKAVDENGKPTEWECAELPQGGGLEMTLLGTYVLTPTARKIYLAMDSYGYKNFFIKYTMPVQTENYTDFYVKNAANIGQKIIQIDASPFCGYGYYHIVNGVIYGETYASTGYDKTGTGHVNGLVRNNGEDKTSLVLEMYPYVTGDEELTIELWGY